MAQAINTNTMATRRQTQKATSKRLAFAMPTFQLSLNKVLFICFLCIIGTVVYGSLRAIDSVLSVPVDDVSVTGELHYQSTQEITQLINRFVDNGFVQVDLKRLQQELTALPWIHHVMVQRQLPNGLLIYVEEQKAKAYWNTDALINEDNQLFTPADRNVVGELPSLSGQDHQRVLALYQQLQTLLPLAQQPIKSVSVHYQHTAVITLANDTQLVIDTADVPAQIQRWNVMQQNLATNYVNAMKKVDLRYSNGAAVEWREQLANLTNKAAGVHN